MRTPFVLGFVLGMTVLLLVHLWIEIRSGAPGPPDLTFLREGATPPDRRPPEPRAGEPRADAAPDGDERLARARAAGLAAAADGVVMADPMLALLLAREGVRASATPAAVGALRRALVASTERAMARAPGTGLRAAAWAPDGSSVVAGAEDGSILAWRPGEPAAAFRRSHESVVTAVAISPDGALVATASDDATAMLSRSDGSLVAELRGHGGALSAVAFSPDGSRVATASRDGTARVFDAGGAEVAVLRGHAAELTSLAWSPDGARLVTGSMDGAPRLWDVASGESRVLGTHDGGVLAVAWSPRGDRIATAGDGGTTRLFDAGGASVAVLEDSPDGVASVAFSPQGDLLVTGGEDGGVRFWSADGAPSAAVRPHVARVASVAFSRDGRRVVTGSWDATARVLDLRGNVLSSLTPRGGWIDGAAFDPSGAHVLTCSRDGTVRVAAADPCEIAALRGHADAVRCVAFTPDGAVWSGSEDGTVRRWRLGASGLVVPDATIAAPVADGVVGLRVQGDRVAALPREGPGFDLRFDATDASDSGTLDRWDAAAVLTAAVGDVAVEAAPEGGLTIRAAGVAREIATGPSRISGVALSADGRWVATAHFDGLVRVWAVRAEDLLAAADARATRELTDAERALWADLLGPPGTSGR